MCRVQCAEFFEDLQFKQDKSNLNVILKIFSSKANSPSVFFKEGLIQYAFKNVNGELT